MVYDKNYYNQTEKVRFAIYKAGPDGSKVDDAIDLVTSLYPWNWGMKPYSHIEFWRANADGKFFDDYGNPLGRCFSSTTRGGAGGVRWEDASVVLRNRHRWDYLEFEVNKIILATTILELEQMIGCEYDYAGLFGFNSENKWYCSEICDLVAVKLHILNRVSRFVISPKRLTRKLIKVAEHEPFDVDWGEVSCD